MVDSESSRLKIQQIFNYLRELNKIKTPPTSDVDSYNWKLKIKQLPEYPSIQISSFDGSSEDDWIIKVSRAKETDCPKLPAELDGWIDNSWDKLNETCTFIRLKNLKSKDGNTYTEKFEENEARVSVFKKWASDREKWVLAERPVREANKIYADLFSLQGTLDREGEKYQLYVSDGFFKLDSEFGKISHPILLRKVELMFNAEKPEFVFKDLDEPSELYTALLRFHELSGEAILKCKNKLKDNDLHPLGNGQTEEFLKYFITRFFRDGEYFEAGTEISSKDIPLIYREPIIFLGTKSQGFSEAIENLIDAIPNMTELPEALLRIIGINPASGSITSGDSSGALAMPLEKKQIDFLLTKPANQEQERVIRKLEETGSVLVQGPPGTGKSHTIANLIGHLLASGNKVLVASHTPKALKVVREKVVDKLRPLCVSVLDNESDSKAQLADSINQIVSHHSRTDVITLETDIASLKERREHLKKHLKKLEDQSIAVRRFEFTDLVLNGESISPSDAGKYVENNPELLWIPSPVILGAPLPLSTEDVHFLYESNRMITLEEEIALSDELPEPDKILSPAEAEELLSSLKNIDKEALVIGEKFWTSEKQELILMDKMIESANSFWSILANNPWLSECIESSLHYGESESPWHQLTMIARDSNQKIKERESHANLHLPVLNSDHSLEIAAEILSHVSAGGGLSSFKLILKPTWKKFISSAQLLDGSNPKTREHFYSIVCHLEILKERKELSLRWDRQVVSVGGLALPQINPERSALLVTDLIQRALNLKKDWDKFKNDLLMIGFNFDLFENSLRNESLKSTYTEDLKRHLIDLINILNARKLFIRQKDLNTSLEKSIIKIQSIRANEQGKKLVFGMLESLKSLNTEKYSQYFQILIEVKSKMPLLEKRKELLDKLETMASGWANSIRSRIGHFGQSSPPERIKDSWKARQLCDLLEERHQVDYSKLQEEIIKTKKQLEEASADYVEKLAWRFQKLNTNQSSWQALQGWMQIQKRITKTGKGKRDHAFLKESRNLIKEAKNAVPVWIMPISKISENFDLATSRFDVLILDEASQSDITSLIAFAIAKKVIVVGDNEQVTPDAVGMDMTRVQNLIEEFLTGIPNAVLYDGKTSIYDLAQQSFDETIRLVEHFRCVPDIISFSNNLSYNGEIKPLRESSSSPYDEHVISHRVEGVRGSGKGNEVEALEIASIIVAMISDPAYENATFGVITLLGDEQAHLIDSILKEKITESQFKKHQLLCGNSSQFQGDERDVIFLSMVDSSDDGTLRLSQRDETKKRYNVAASRARNQLWVVHSLNPNVDLKLDDLRLRLIRHAENPKAAQVHLEAVLKKSESVFEDRVIESLVNNGYKVIPQWKVGAYRIDLVVVGLDGKKIAIECDGERYHPEEKLKDDVYRQMTLERLGWSFIRIRGSEFFKNPSLAMNKVFSRLDRFGIEKTLLLENHKLEEISKDELSQKELILQKAFILREEWKLKKS